MTNLVSVLIEQGDIRLKVQLPHRALIGQGRQILQQIVPSLKIGQRNQPSEYRQHDQSDLTALTFARINRDNLWIYVCTICRHYLGILSFGP